MIKGEPKKRPTAEVGIQSLRESLGVGDPKFQAAQMEEEEAESLCTRVRKELRDKRKAMRIDQAAVAEKMNLSQSAVSKIESSRGDIGLKTLYRHSKALGLRPVVLFVSEPYSISSDHDNKSLESVGENSEIVNVQDVFLKKMAEMVPALTARKIRSA